MLAFRVMKLLLAVALLLTASCASWREDREERADLHLRMGTAHFSNGNYPMALKELLEAEKLDPSSPLIQNNVGLTYYMRERFELAEKHLRKAVQLKKDYSDARNNLARVLIDLNRFAEAEKELQIVINDLTYGSIERAYINLGLARFNQKNWQGAAQAFEKAINAQRDNCVANSYFGRTYFEMGQYKKATDSLDRAIGFCQKQLFDEPHYYSALAWYRLGDKERSIARFEEVTKLYPEGKYREKALAMLDLIRKGTQ